MNCWFLDIRYYLLCNKILFPLNGHVMSVCNLKFSCGVLMSNLLSRKWYLDFHGINFWSFYRLNISASLLRALHIYVLVLYKWYGVFWPKAMDLLFWIFGIRACLGICAGRICWDPRVDNGHLTFGSQHVERLVCLGVPFQYMSIFRCPSLLGQYN